ncbi:ATP-binding protein [Actinokineospora xionganensis]|uniref:AAA family ATPase n=1 Tax=Actinokineospora xionganensis TaxID=2684470 RepID=A0ABR7LC92_9PSEU|nr:LuxR C-terminal-related transcriptional regulator [Actinokineospora xionganensis]MBC6450113.1 AAA family ATPase [Actinokineospora xionganensis]
MHEGPEPLPVDRTSYVGRDEELAVARKLLAAGPIVTLVGPGGVGKSRLAARVATEARFNDGVAFIELADLGDPQLLASTVADRLGLRDQSARPAVDAVVEHLRDRRTLLVLDNCEHLVGACGAFVAALVSACPRLAVLATSRQSLGIAGERLLSVLPLAAPGVDEVVSAADAQRFDSVRLFADRAAAVVPGFTVTDGNCRDIARVCRALEGLPLAIELAAVRLRSLSLGQIAGRLTRPMSLLTVGRRTGPPRQQTLRAMIDWSHQLCSEPERLVWARASVFSGTFGLEAAEQVCGGAGVEPGLVLDLVDALLDKSILVREEQDGLARYRMLETLREYGHDRLVASGDADRVRRLHRDWYAELTARLESGWVGKDQIAWVARLRNEHANLRAALDFCVTEPGEATAGLVMATRIGPYWGIRSLYSEARMWIDRTLALTPARAPGRVGALRLHGMFALLQGDREAAERLLAEAEELCADRTEGAYLAVVRGMAALFAFDGARARDLLDDARAVFRESGVLNGELFAAYLGALATALCGDPDKGRIRLRETIATCERMGEVSYHSLALWALSSIEILYGDSASAHRATLPALRLTGLIDNRIVEAFLVTNLVLIAADKGEHRRCALLLGAADSMWTALGTDPEEVGWLSGRRRDAIAATREALGEAAFTDARATGRAMPRREAVRVALNDTVPTITPVAGDFGPLTRREAEIAGLIAQGLTNKDIAARLFIAPRTAETHVAHILAKLGFNTRAQIAGWVVRLPERAQR